MPGRSRCRHASATVEFTLAAAASMIATVRTVRHGRATGRTLAELDFAGPPGRNRRRLALGSLRAGRYALRVVAVDGSSGLTSRPAVLELVVG